MCLTLTSDYSTVPVDKILPRATNIVHAVLYSPTYDLVKRYAALYIQYNVLSVESFYGDLYCIAVHTCMLYRNTSWTPIAVVQA